MNYETKEYKNGRVQETVKKKTKNNLELPYNRISFCNLNNTGGNTDGIFFVLLNNCYVHFP